jgi:hypothetical protein
VNERLARNGKPFATWRLQAHDARVTKGWLAVVWYGRPAAPSIVVLGEGGSAPYARARHGHAAKGLTVKGYHPMTLAELGGRVARIADAKVRGLAATRGQERVGVGACRPARCPPLCQRPLLTAESRRSARC